MNKTNKTRNHILGILLLTAVTGCDKYLKEKSSAKLVIPSTLADLQSMLDYTTTMTNRDPAAPEVSADNYYLTASDYAALSSDYYKRMYIWSPSDLFAPQDGDWYFCSVAIYTANSVLYTLSYIDRSTHPAEWDNVRGQALFYRAKNYYGELCTWSQAYDSSTADRDLGVPLRLDPDFNPPSRRATVRESYRQVLADLLEAAPLLPVTPLHVVRPSRPAAYGLLARIYLSMRQYDKALQYADSALKLFPTLLDYNTLTASATYPIPQFNGETIYYSVIPVATIINKSRAKIDTNLLALYADNDLRKTIFFQKNADGSSGFKGNYTQGLSQFGGIATDELYLIRAECRVRLGGIDGALSDMNALLRSRWSTGSFDPLQVNDPALLLDTVLQERRKELLMRGLRWMDIKRLNKEGRQISLQRHVGSDMYTLPPNDPRFALPIPEDIILLSGMEQNPR